MEILAMLNGRLDFIARFYEQAAAPFETTKKQIEAQEEPYLPNGDPEAYDEPPFTAEWIEADECLNTLGLCTLGLLEKALHDCLREFIDREARGTSEQFKDCLNSYSKQGGWFGKFACFLEDRTSFTWSASPVHRDQLEQINLTRNDAAHNPHIDRAWTMQSDDHWRKYAVSAFADPIWVKAMSFGDNKPVCPVPLLVTREKLAVHIGYVQEFCTHIEGFRTSWR